MLMKEMALKLEVLSLAEFVKALKEEDVSFLQAREGICWRKKSQKNICEELVSWQTHWTWMGDDSELHVLMD